MHTLVAATLCLGFTLQAQSPQSAPLRFDAAVLQLNTAGSQMSRVSLAHAQANLTNVSLARLLAMAYDVGEERVVGPGWLNVRTYDVVAKAPAGTSDAQLKTMLRTLLQDRLGLVAHLESQEKPIYALLVDKSGAKIQEQRDDDPIAPTPAMPPSSSLFFVAGPLSTFASRLSTAVGRIVVDKTGLAGQYRIFLVYEPLSSKPDGSASDPGTNLSTALREQLGLRLESQKGPVDFLVVDHVQKAPREEF